MRKIVVLSFITLDGVMQAPGGPTEDTSGKFTLGGWTVPYFDDFLGEVMTEQMGKPFDLLLGRKTFEIFASYWPHHPEEGAGINAATKHVASNTLTTHAWKKSVFLNGEVAEKIKKLKQGEGSDLQVHGSYTLIQTLLEPSRAPATDPDGHAVAKPGHDVGLAHALVLPGHPVSQFSARGAPARAVV